MNLPITDHELTMLEKTSSEEEWVSALELLKTTRGGEMPVNYLSAVIASGLQERAQNRWRLAAQSTRPKTLRIRPRNGRLAVRLSPSGLQRTGDGLILPESKENRSRLVQALVIGVDPHLADNATGPGGQPAICPVQEGNLILMYAESGWDVMDGEGRYIRLIDASSVWAVLEPENADGSINTDAKP